MGHFGRPAIRRAWFSARLPGAGAQLRRAGGARAALAARRSSSPSSSSCRTGRASRSSSLATLATVIASQAVISGAFSVTRQAVQLGFLPRLVIRHTSRSEVGQVYVPAVNWGLFVAVVALVVGFGSSARAGRPPTGSRSPARWRSTRCCSSVVVRGLWRKPLWLAVGGAAGFLAVDLAFLAANVPKVLHGGWFPLRHRRGRVHDHEHLAARADDPDPQPRGPGGPAPGLRRPRPRAAPARAPLGAHRGVPQRRPDDDAAGAAGEPRAQRGPAPHRRHPHRRRAQRPARPGRGAAVGRRPGLRRRRDHATSPRASASRTTSTCPPPCGWRRTPAWRRPSTSTSRPGSCRRWRWCPRAPRGWPCGASTSSWLLSRNAGSPADYFGLPVGPRRRHGLAGRAVRRRGGDLGAA